MLLLLLRSTASQRCRHGHSHRFTSISLLSSIVPPPAPHRRLVSPLNWPLRCQHRCWMGQDEREREESPVVILPPPSPLPVVVPTPCCCQPPSCTVEPRRRKGREREGMTSGFHLFIYLFIYLMTRLARACHVSETAFKTDGGVVLDGCNSWGTCHIWFCGWGIRIRFSY